MNISIPREVNFIIETLKKNNYDAYAVGGCVRDSILKRTPNDWDITTNALPEQILKLFEHTIPTGLKHGTVTIILNKLPFEVMVNTQITVILMRYFLQIPLKKT